MTVENASFRPSIIKKTRRKIKRSSQKSAKSRCFSPRRPRRALDATAETLILSSKTARAARFPKRDAVFCVNFQQIPVKHPQFTPT
jgi:hypothetical protein